jgi:enamine deaminase RidA (YjgF/YER057c/UK114 family)
MPKKYFVFLPLITGSIEEEWKQCLNQIIKTRNSGYTPVKLNIFIEQPDFKTFLGTRKTISKSVTDTFNGACPAFNITIQPPEKQWKVAVEAAFVVTGSQNITRKSYNSIPYVVIESESGKEVWAGGVSGYSYPDDTRSAAENAFDLMVKILDKEQMSLNHVVRQWNYVGEILTVKEEFQNYQIFNEVRSEYYHRYRDIKGYPAATGVGIKHGGVILDFFALYPHESVIIKPLNNPNQVNPYDYGQQVLKGMSDKSETGKHPPQFERGLLLANNQAATLFISGTAAIIGQETIGKEDVEKQTIVTIENIKKLADTERISQLMTKPVLFNEKYSLLRVYIRRQNDFKLVREICNEHFPQIPAIYLEADICRDDLLVEIEAEVELE